MLTLRGGEAQVPEVGRGACPRGVPLAALFSSLGALLVLKQVQRDLCGRHPNVLLLAGENASLGARNQRPQHAVLPVAGPLRDEDVM